MAARNARSLSAREVSKRILQILVLVILFYSLLGVRALQILGIGEISYLPDLIWFTCGVISLLLLGLERPLFCLFFASLFGGILWLSFTKLFHPSLAADVPMLDFLFFDRVSSNYCFDLAKKYVGNVAVPFFVFSAFFGFFFDDQKRAHRFLLVSFFACLIINLTVIAFQGLWSIDFLASGSGTAISSGRASGLLEDSGASTIVMSSLLVFFFVVLCESNWKGSTKAVLWIGWLCLIMLGKFTGGRSYFSVILLGVCLYSCLRILALNFRSRLVVLLTLTVSALAGYWYLKNSIFAHSTFNGSIFVAEPLPIHIIGWLDPIRGAHNSILWKSIFEYWPGGIGLGGSHIAIAQHASDFSSKGVPVSGDAPLNFFLGFLLEGGVCALLIMLSVIERSVQTLRSAWIDPKSKIFSFSVLFLLSCLAISCLVGTQIIFRSVALLVAFCLAYLYSPFSGAFSSPFRGLQGLTLAPLIAAVFCLVMFSLKQYSNPPRVPEFYWSRQGKPQLPLGYNVPIATPQKSQWMAPGIPFAFRGDAIEFFVELPPEYYPLQMSVAIFASKSGEKLFEQDAQSIEYDALHPGRTVSISVSPDVTAFCLEKWSPLDYCYATIKSNRHWRVSRNIAVGYSLMKPLNL